jgi:hypothetical protein
MIEAEWLECTDPKLMLAFLRGKAREPLICTDPTPWLEFLRGRVSERKFRLFACEFCRSVWHRFADGRRNRQTKSSRNAVEVAERFADGEATAAELAVTWQCAQAAEPPPDWAPVVDAAEDADYAIFCASWAARDDAARGASGVADWAVTGDAVGDGASARQVTLLRCIFGNPFRPVQVDPAWLGWHDGATVRIAQMIYEERCFQNLPILADALEEAGCTDPDILGHCQSGSAHVRGCWVIDALLEKE